MRREQRDILASGVHNDLDLRVFERLREWIAQGGVVELPGDPEGAVWASGSTSSIRCSPPAVSATASWIRHSSVR